MKSGIFVLTLPVLHVLMRNERHNWHVIPMAKYPTPNMDNMDNKFLAAAYSC